MKRAYLRFAGLALVPWLVVGALVPEAAAGGEPPVVARGMLGMPGRVEISWSTDPGQTYQLQSVVDLSGEWTTHATDPAVLLGGGAWLRIEVPVEGTSRFFRVVRLEAVERDYLVIDLSEGPTALSYPVSYMDSVPPGGWTDEYKTTKLVMRRIPAGTFMMGSPEDELERWEGEDQRQVTLTKDFYIGVFEVTQKQWERVMGNWPSWFYNPAYRDSRPVETVSYFQIRENPNNSAISPNWPQSSQVHGDSFVGKLRAKTGLTTLDLPTEAQWEYACRAGTTTALNSGKNLAMSVIASCPNMAAVGRYYYNSWGFFWPQDGSTDGGTAKVGTYLPNGWGLYDMHGNVREWCLDWYEEHHAPVVDPVGAASGSDRVARGGHWDYGPQICRSAYRIGITPSFPDNYFRATTGFRLSRTLP